MADTKTATDGAAAAAGSHRVRAKAKHLRFSAQKGRLVVDQIRGRRVADAAATLAFSPRAAARDINKVLRSAVANAENNHGMSAGDLLVAEVFVDEGPTIKRWKPRARGRADKINKRTSHVTIILDQAPEPEDGKGKGGDRAARVAASKGEKAPATAAAKKDDGAAKAAGDDTAKSAKSTKSKTKTKAKSTKSKTKAKSAKSSKSKKASAETKPKAEKPAAESADDTPKKSDTDKDA